MWNLIKNVLRSLSKNKVSVIGLTLLTFLAIALYTVLTSATGSIIKEYNYITKSGNLHDFTISEKYNLGNAKWVIEEESWGWSNSTDGPSSEDKPDVYWPTQPDVGDPTTRIYHLTLDPSIKDEDTLIGHFFQEHDNVNDPYYGILHPTCEINGSPLEYLRNTQEDKWSNRSFSECNSQWNSSGDNEKLLSFEQQCWQSIMNIISNTDTPIQDYLTNDPSIKDKISSWRNFRSIDINNSPDGIYYKIVQSSPDDAIDKMVTFDNSNSWHSDNDKNFSIFDFNPLLDDADDEYYPNKDVYANLYDTNSHKQTMIDVLNYSLPSTPTADNWPYIEAYFHMLIKGNTKGIEDPTLYKDDGTGLINFLGSNTHKHPNIASEYEQKYEDYIDDYVDKSVSSHHNYKFTINWSTQAPSAWYIEDWTSCTTIAAPKYMSKHHLSSLSDKSFVNEDSYMQWCEKHQDLQNERTRFIGWMNSLKEEDRDAWINRTADNYSQSTIRLGGEGSVPYLIINQGITVDFAYPIVNITNSTPNPNKECIFFTNANGYARAFDSYRSNPVENYLVGKFANGVDKQNTLDLINAKCQEVMTWPKDIKAAYMANDTNDVLNASAFRIAYIPIMINRIQNVSLALTIFILILSVCICGIIIHRYIGNARTQIGIMFANGIKKWQIGLSLLPFALIPAIFGGIIGYIVGFSLQGPTVGLFSNYWMLPVIGVHFSILTMMMMIFIPFIVFIGVSFVSTLIILHEKTVNLMKSSSEFKTNWVSRHIKQPFASFNILTKFRISFAFNSLTRLIVLTLMVAMSMTSLVFNISTSDKFQVAQNLTTSSRNYTYAIDLFSPTSQAGQYIPVNADNYGESGFVKTSEGDNWVPNLYYDDYFIKPYNAHAPQTPDYSYIDIFGRDDSATNDDTPFDNFYGIPKVYYETTYALYDLLHSSDTGGISRSFSQDGMVSGTTWYPMSADSMGENYDIMYVKNRSMIQNAMDYTVGIMGYAASNPWMIALSLMPENQKNLCDTRTTYLVQQLGEATNYVDIIDDGSNGRYKEFYESHKNDDTWDEWKSYFNVAKDSRKPTHDDPTTTLYSINKEECVDSLGINLKPDFMHFLNIAYHELKVINRTYNSMLDNEYEILYNKVPLKFSKTNINENDETYTYLSTDSNNSTNASNFIKGNNRIVGIKDDSKFVNLVNDSGKNISHLISTSVIQNGDENPIIVNAFAAKKHNLSIGSHITFNITNKSDRYQQQINKLIDNTSSNDNSTTFTVVGINTTYEGEEYFTNQQLANKILGLKSMLTPKYDLHNYYVNSWFAENLFNVDDFLPNTDVFRDNDHSWEKPGNFIVDLSLPPTGYKRTLEVDQLDNPASSLLHSENINPYGYNGVFTNKTNGSTILNGGISLYSPSGIYPGNDNLSSKVVEDILKNGINLEMTNIISGMYDPSKKNLYSEDWIGRQINDAFEKWIKTKDRNDYDAYIGYVDKFINTLTPIFGQTVVTSLVSGAIDRDSLRLVFTNLSNTIAHIEELTIAIITFMVSIIVILIAIMLIGDSKKLAATLKALGYTDKQNILSFLSIYAPVIAFGLALAIPLSYVATYIFQDVIFNGANILLTTTIPWWSFLISIGAIGIILGLSIIVGHYSLKRDPLVNQLKE